jgi:hypothetical protein
MKELRIMSVCGFLGYGYPEESLKAGLARNPHVIGVDSGSTDPGPYYLGSGNQLIQKPQMVRDLGLSLMAARQAGVPYVIGSAGTAGGEPHVDSVLDVVREVAVRDGLRFRMAVIRSEIDKETVKSAIREKRVRSLGKMPALTEDEVDRSVRVVGQMGVGPFIKAFEGGAEVIIAGRSCDTAIFASMAVMHGYDLGLSYHMGKIIECGAMSATPANGCDGMMATMRGDYFELEPLSAQRRLSPTSVAAHMMYEQPGPYVFYEPEGAVDLRDTEMEQVDDRHVRVRGTRFIPADAPTLKLEGARLCGYRTITVAGVTDPIVIARLDEVEAMVRDAVTEMLHRDLDSDDYDLRFIYYGRGGVLQAPRSGPESSPSEIGVVIEVIGRDQPTADSILALARSSFLHCGFEGRKATAGNLAFPFSPSDLQGGPVYEFNVYHLMKMEDPSAPFSVEFEQVG